MNSTEIESIRTIRGSANVCEYDLLLRRIVDADEVATKEWATESRDGWELASEKVTALIWEAEQACTALLADLVSQGVPAFSGCGEGGDFRIHFVGEDGRVATLAGFHMPTSVSGVVFE